MIRFTFATLVVALAQPTVAWSADTPRSRADVKAETRALEKSGQLTPAGEGSPASADANFKSTKTRSERKAETVLAAKHHELQPAGPAGSYKADNRGSRLRCCYRVRSCSLC